MAEQILAEIWNGISLDNFRAVWKYVKEVALSPIKQAWNATHFLHIAKCNKWKCCEDFCTMCLRLFISESINCCKYSILTNMPRSPSVPHPGYEDSIIVFLVCGNPKVLIHYFQKTNTWYFPVTLTLCQWRQGGQTSLQRVEHLSPKYCFKNGKCSETVPWGQERCQF